MRMSLICGLGTSLAAAGSGPLPGPSGAVWHAVGLVAQDHQLQTRNRGAHLRCAGAHPHRQSAHLTLRGAHLLRRVRTLGVPAGPSLTILTAGAT